MTYSGLGIGVLVEVLEVDGAEARTFARENTVEQQLEEFKKCGVGANVSRVTCGCLRW